MNPDIPGILTTLARGGVEFVVIGGVAATVHGSARSTFDVDIAYDRAPRNLDRLAASLRPLHPRLRDAPDGLPFQLDAATLRNGLNFTLATDLGPLDLLGEVAGAGSFDELRAGSETLALYGQTLRVVSLHQLIRIKRAAGRPRDLQAIAELEALREERKRS